MHDDRRNIEESKESTPEQGVGISVHALRETAIHQ